MLWNPIYSIQPWLLIQKQRFKLFHFYYSYFFRPSLLQLAIIYSIITIP